MSQKWASYLVAQSVNLGFICYPTPWIDSKMSLICTKEFHISHLGLIAARARGEPEARLFLLLRCFLLVSANNWQEIVAVDFARTRRSLLWQFPRERCYTLPVICTCATLLSCTPEERAFVLLGSLCEQTEHKEAAIGLSVFLGRITVETFQKLS